MKEIMTIKERAKEYLEDELKQDKAEDFKRDYPILFQSIIKSMTDFHKQELANALPSDGEIMEEAYVHSEKFAEHYKRLAYHDCIYGAEWLKQQILNNIK